MSTDVGKRTVLSGGRAAHPAGPNKRQSGTAQTPGASDSGSRQEEAVAVTATGEELHGIEQGRLLLDLIEDHQARAVVQAAYRVGGDPQSLVGVVEITKGGIAAA